MNPTNAKRYSIIALVLSMLTIIISVVFFLVVISKAAAIMTEHSQSTLTEAQIQDLSVQLVLPMLMYLLILSVVGIVYIVFYILAIVESYKLQDNRTPFILLLVGILVPIPLIPIFGLIMLIVESNKILNTPPEQDSSIDAFYTE